MKERTHDEERERWASTRATQACGVSAHVALFVVFTLWACDPKPSRTERAPAERRSPAASASAAALASAPAGAEPAGAGDAPPATPAKRQPPAALPKAGRDDLPSQNSRFVLDELNEVGPAAPASAFGEGVVLVTRADELALAKLAEPPSQSAKPAAGRIAPVAQPADAFWPVARGPAIGKSHAYWISKGRLVRKPLGGGALEVLRSDARNGTRVAVAGSPDSVAYIGAPVGDGEPKAKLRLPDGRVLELTPEGAAASSVTLSEAGEDLIASSIDGRSGMTPLHARRVRLKGGALDPDVVVWVAGATQAQTELSSVASPSGPWLLLPVEQDASRFGLAALALSLEPKMDPPLRWRTYENGLDRAPVAAAQICGAPMALYVRPSEARPGATQELVISELDLADTASSEPLATARGFADISVRARPEGALLAYVADRHTWARLIRCKKS